METRNALIKSTFLGVEDHGIFTLWLRLEWDGSGQGAGGRALDESKDGNRVGTIYGHQMIIDILQTVGVSKWEDLPGKHIRIKSDHSRVYEIGNLLKDDWMEM